VHLLEQLERRRGGLEHSLDDHSTQERRGAAGDLAGGDGVGDAVPRRQLLDQAGDQVEEALPPLGEGLSQVVPPGGIRPELKQQRFPLRLALLRFEAEARDRAVDRLEVASVQRDAGVSPRTLLEVCVEDGEEEIGLACEVRVDGALRVSGRLGDVIEAGAMRASSARRATRNPCASSTPRHSATASPSSPTRPSSTPLEIKE
jgi:hypothetical protein